MRRRHLSLTALIAFVACALFATGCTNPAPPGGFNLNIRAMQITVVDANDNGPTPNFWDADWDDEPYLVHIGLRIQLTAPVYIEAHATSVEATGRYMCDAAEGMTCLGQWDDGIGFNGVYLPDWADLQNGTQPLQLIGTLEVAMEKDTPVGVGGGVTSFFSGVAETIEAAALPIILGGGTLPTDPQGLLNFVQAVLPPALSAIISLIGVNLLGSVFGTDQVIGLAPMFFFAVGGVLAGNLIDLMPTLLWLINWYLTTQENSPFPDGLPVKLAVLGQVMGLSFGSTFQDPFTLYETVHATEIS